MHYKKILKIFNMNKFDFKVYLSSLEDSKCKLEKELSNISNLNYMDNLFEMVERSIGGKNNQSSDYIFAIESNLKIEFIKGQEHVNSILLKIKEKEEEYTLASKETSILHKKAEEIELEHREANNIYFQNLTKINVFENLFYSIDEIKQKSEKHNFSISECRNIKFFDKLFFTKKNEIFIRIEHIHKSAKEYDEINNINGFDNFEELYSEIKFAHKYYSKIKTNRVDIKEKEDVNYQNIYKSQNKKQKAKNELNQIKSSIGKPLFKKLFSLLTDKEKNNLLYAYGLPTLNETEERKIHIKKIINEKLDIISFDHEHLTTLINDFKKPMYNIEKEMQNDIPEKDSLYYEKMYYSFEKAKKYFSDRISILDSAIDINNNTQNEKLKENNTTFSVATLVLNKIDYCDISIIS